MIIVILGGIFIYKLILVLAKEADLPLCPTNVLYFPQNLPMHCRMPTNADFAGGPAPIPTVPPFYQSLPPDKQPLPIPIPMPPGIPGPIPMPGPIPGPMALPGGPIPFPGPMPMPLPGGPAHKLPVIVMPFYSPDPNFKKSDRPNLPPMRPRRRRRRRRKPFFPPSIDSSSSTDADTSSDTSSSSSSEYDGWWKGNKNSRRFHLHNKRKKIKHHQKRQLLTPVLQYVTKDGYVIFEKKISKNEAKDWLTVNRDEGLETSTRIATELEGLDSNEPNGIQSKEKESVTDDAEILTKRNQHRHNVYKSIKANKNKSVRKKFVKQP